MFRKNMWKWINLAAFVLMVSVNALAELLPIAGYTTGQISAMYSTPLTPAPFSFGIWGVIYLYLAVFLLAQLAKPKDLNITGMLGPWFVFSCCFNIAWIIAWHYRAMTVAVLLMLCLLLVMILIEGNLREQRSNYYERWLVRAPFSIYYGWITVAAIANISVWLMSIGFDGLGLPSQFWETAVLLIGGTVICIGIWVNHDVLYGLAGLWGYVGIMVRQLATDTVGINNFWSVTAITVCLVAGLCMVLVTALDEMNLNIPVLKSICRTNENTER